MTCGSPRTQLAKKSGIRLLLPAIDGDLVRIVRGPRIIDFGVSSDGVKERLRRLDLVLAEAQRLGADVHYS